MNRTLLFKLMVPSITIMASPLALAAGRHDPSIGGMLLIDTSYSKGFDDSKITDIYVDTFLIHVNKDINKYVNIHTAIKHEETPLADDNNIKVDEAYIGITVPDESSLNILLGRQYVPFGNYSTFMITNPLAFYLAKINDSALAVKYNDVLVAHAFLMNGNTAESGTLADKKNNTAEYGLGLGYETAQFKVSADWINSIAESDTVVDTTQSSIALKNYVAGWDFHAEYEVDAFEISTEYVSTTKKFQNTEYTFNDAGAKPSTWDVEFNYRLGYKNSWAGLRYSQSKEFLFLNQPKNMLSLGYGQEIFKHTLLKFEAYRQKDYVETDTALRFNGLPYDDVNYSPIAVTGTGNITFGCAVQLGVEF